MLSPGEIASRIRERALKLGFHDVGICAADALTGDRARLESWLAGGMHGEMDWMARDPAERADPGRLVPGARSVIALACSYREGDPPPRPTGQADPGRIARYAWGRDYHRTLGLKLKDLRETLGRLSPGCKARSFVDSSPLLERAVARKAGLGFVGKNTLLIHRELGSWIFLAAIVTDLELPVDASGSGDCGQCRLCLDACPTDAFAAPYVLDARRCISHWTIEAEGEPPPELAAKFGDWLFGCDVCQEVCPYNHRPLRPGPPSLFAAQRSAGPWLDAADLESMEEPAFRRRFKRTPLTRPGLKRMAANARRLRRNLEPPG